MFWRVWAASCLAASCAHHRDGMVRVGEHDLFLTCRGRGPTVVLEAGAAGTSSDWSAVSAALSSRFRVCAYDRAGLGRSEAQPLPRDARADAIDLHDLLARAHIPAPYLLIGHSYGALIAQLFAHHFADELFGLVLVDSPQEEFFVPPPGEAAVPAVDWTSSFAQAREVTNVRAIPLVVLTALRVAAIEPAKREQWWAAQEGLTRLSALGVQLMVNDDLQIPLHQPKSIVLAVDLIWSKHVELERRQ